MYLAKVCLLYWLSLFQKYFIIIQNFFDWLGWNPHESRQIDHFRNWQREWQRNMAKEKQQQLKRSVKCVVIVHGVHKNRINSWRMWKYTFIVSVPFSPVCIVNHFTQVLYETRVFLSFYFIFRFVCFFLIWNGYSSFLRYMQKGFRLNPSSSSSFSSSINNKSLPKLKQGKWQNTINVLRKDSQKKLANSAKIV